MRTTQIFVRAGLTIAAAAALPLALTAPSAFAAGGITVTATGSTVTVTTAACVNGGDASLMSNGQSSFAQGRQVELTGGSASWQNVSTGVHTVAVVCEDGSAAGSQTVTVGASPTTSSTTAPARGVRGGLGGGSEDYGTLTLAAGGALVALAGVGGGTWYLRRRGAQHRL
ncbi:hypothetical protein GCM10009837_47060 [Streptomyces durmitorensis]|uniref:Uncharacterized protein n=1 Tax=Streptomyces durmitorensis TaxID=319947 RepID=A0ABY4Q526_9ACTN|nr:hypothetical protein [Streptomyces durmitorensis]UQT60318.1 hypothetical protein M4V62_37575 [Streptomyces durmitorensis]